MLRNRSLLVPFLLLVHVTSAAALPPCSGTPVSASICGLTEPNMPRNIKMAFRMSVALRFGPMEE